MGLVALQHVGSSRTRAKSVSPVLVGRFLTTVPPGKPSTLLFKNCSLLGGDKCCGERRKFEQSEGCQGGEQALVLNREVHIGLIEKVTFESRRGRR